MEEITSAEAQREMDEAQANQDTPQYRHFERAVLVAKSYQGAIDLLHDEALAHADSAGFRQWPEVRERMRLQYDAQSRILDRIADDMELYLPDSSYTAEFHLRFAQLRQEVAEQIEEWQ